MSARHNRICAEGREGENELCVISIAVVLKDMQGYYFTERAGREGKWKTIKHTGLWETSGALWETRGALWETSGDSAWGYMEPLHGGLSS